MKKTLIITLLILSSTLVFSQFKYGVGAVYEFERNTDLLKKSYGIHGRVSYEVLSFVDVVAAAELLILKEGFYGATGNRLRLNININVIENESFCLNLIGGYNSSQLGDYTRATAPEFGIGVRLGQVFIESRYTDNKSINDGFVSFNIGFHF